MNFKVLVCFYDDGVVREICLNKEDCKGECEEYIAKLIPIERDYNVKLDIEDVTRSLAKSTKELKKGKTELERVVKKFKIR